MSDEAPAPWTRTARRTLIQDPWLTLHADTYRTAEGHEVTPYYLSERADWVFVVALDDADRILLVEQYRPGIDALSLELPGGVIDAEDADAIAAGQRELMEETGCEGDAWTVEAVLSPNPALQTNYCHIVTTRAVRAVASPQDAPTERMRLHWVPIDEAVRRAFAGEIIQAMHVAGLAIALGRMGRWHG